MENSSPPSERTAMFNQAEAFLQQLQAALADEDSLRVHRGNVKRLISQLNTDSLSCAAALLALLSPALSLRVPEGDTLKMVRYRLDIGSEHKLTLPDLKKVLVDESGVDKNNIQNVSIRALYTLIDLPDAMPSDIFQHLKTVELYDRPLAIKRVKIRYKKRGNYRRGRARSVKV
jgi:hypothetical protein